MNNTAQTFTFQFLEVRCHSLRCKIQMQFVGGRSENERGFFFSFVMESPNDHIPDQLCPCLQKFYSVQGSQVNSVFLFFCFLFLKYRCTQWFSLPMGYYYCSQSRSLSFQVECCSGGPSPTYSSFLNVELGLSLGGHLGIQEVPRVQGQVHVVHYFPALIIIFL